MGVIFKGSVHTNSYYMVSPELQCYFHSLPQYFEQEIPVATGNGWKMLIFNGLYHCDRDTNLAPVRKGLSSCSGSRQPYPTIPAKHAWLGEELKRRTGQFSRAVDSGNGVTNTLSSRGLGVVKLPNPQRREWRFSESPKLSLIQVI